MPEWFLSPELVKSLFGCYNFDPENILLKNFDLNIYTEAIPKFGHYYTCMQITYHISCFPVLRFLAN